MGIDTAWMPDLPLAEGVSSPAAGGVSTPLAGGVSSTLGETGGCKGGLFADPVRCCSGTKVPFRVMRWVTGVLKGVPAAERLGGVAAGVSVVVAAGELFEAWLTGLGGGVIDSDAKAGLLGVDAGVTCNAMQLT